MTKFLKYTPKYKNFLKIPRKYTVNKLRKDPKFHGTLTQKERKNATKRQLKIEHLMFKTTNLRRPRKFYTNAVCVGHDI